MKPTPSQANAVILSTATSLTFFWILTLLKAAYPPIKAALNFYPPVGPLLGLYSSSLLVLLISYSIIKTKNPTNQQRAFWALLISSVAFFIMVFPPVFEPIAHALSN